MFISSLRRSHLVFYYERSPRAYITGSRFPTHTPSEASTLSPALKLYIGHKCFISIH
ncbi:MAG: hypothetical protein RMZ41_001480 [Nostoc sp. DedVER02]